ncbi:hypothetical protein NDN08_008286 [Rhodosorus marinus]|uniref:Ferritin n=1 Tax=Rhodosorus marinus TaxID=101924 RepID=A0AAV8V3E0_9RHOD|nr:hypothetical protein NDN08_008286 [Rhodosorus marinus]
MENSKDENKLLHDALSEYVLTAANQPTLGLHYAAMHMKTRVGPFAKNNYSNLTQLSESLLDAQSHVKFATNFLREHNAGILVADRIDVLIRKCDNSLKIRMAKSHK